jgi:hypothetical protein
MAEIVHKPKEIYLEEFKPRIQHTLQRHKMDNISGV